jgi:hypothetical protein
MNNNQKNDKKREKKLKREKRIKRQKLLQRESLMNETKETHTREKMQYQTRQRQTPVVNSGDSILERNMKILEAALADKEALEKFREDMKGKSLEEIKNQQKEYMEQYDREQME